MSSIVYTYVCDGVVGTNGRNKCQYGYENAPMDRGLHTTVASAVNAGLNRGYKRPYDADNIPLGDTTHMCCSNCFREYQRWNKAFPIPKPVVEADVLS